MYKLGEEIVRWALEVNIKSKNNDWIVAFSNPSAGPWKKIVAADQFGNIGEVHRFGSKDRRPDLILLNDRLKVIIIFEAKGTNIKDLYKEKQVNSSIKSLYTLIKNLQILEQNNYWKNRLDYTIIFGLNWGSVHSLTESSLINDAFDTYIKELQKERIPYFCDSVIVGIETHQNKSDDGLQLICHSNNFDKIVHSNYSIRDICQSLFM